MPWFVNWDDYKTSFEQEAGRILGHPVHVVGSAKASILPSPSLTFTDVEVGDAGGATMMTVDRFEVTVELMPLIQGQVHVISMRLAKPRVAISTDETGAVDWLKRAPTADILDPDRVTLADVQISDGTISYSDAGSGVSIELDSVNASVEATSLAGPWRVDGSYLDGGKAVPFRIATGRRLDDGTIRVKTDISPARWPVAVSADGVLGLNGETGVAYGGTYSVTEVVAATEGDQAPASDSQGDDTATGWRSQGTFALSHDRISIEKAILSNGPADRPTSLAGSLVVKFGKNPSFEASAETRQLDLDRAFGGGPSEPVEVSAAASRFVGWLTALPVPAMPGQITFDVPAIVVGGSVIQNVAFTAAPAVAGWQISGLRADLPGSATLSADGTIATGKRLGFVGTARLAVAQPATFASWWRGGAGEGGGQLLAAFDISGKTEIAPGMVSVQDIDARIGDATIKGSFAWSARERDHYRHLGTDLQADRIDFVQVKALADLLVGRNLTDTTALADSFSVRLFAGAFQFEDIRMKGVTVDADYTNDVLNVVKFGIDDLGGSSFKVTSGRIDGLTTNPRGHLESKLEVDNLDGLALIAGKLAPDSGLLQWLGRISPSLTPAVVNAKIVAPPQTGGTGMRVSLDGVAGPTTFNATVESAGKSFLNWRSERATLDVVLDSPDSAALAHQVGLDAAALTNDSGAHIEVHGAGVPNVGLDTTLISEFAGVTTNAHGKLTFAAGSVPSFGGTFGVSADDLDPLIATAGLAIPGAATGTKVSLDGTIASEGAKATLTWQNGTFGDRAVSGTVALGKEADKGWRIDGDLAVDAVDLDWLMSLSLGFSPLAGGDDNAPWSKSPFSAPTYGPLSGKVTVATEHVAIGDSLDIANAKLELALQPQRIDIDLKGGSLAGGTANGGVSIANVDGNANFNGQISLQGAALESFIWQRDDRAVATGVFDLSGSFEATGRSPAGLISSMTGGGTISVRNGEARYVNPNTARLVVRASDLGQEYTDEALRSTLADQIDADSFHFEETGGAFALAAGAIRLKNLSARGQGIEATGDAVIDLNTETLDSDWTLTFDPGDAKVQGTDPKVGLVFRGPLAAPTRTVDALPFGSYLNTRREARMLEIIAMEEADRAERERLGRLIIKVKQDKERVDREAREAAEAERRRLEILALATAKVAELHVDREMLLDRRAAEALQRSLDLATAAKANAEQAAADARQRAGEERAKANAAADLRTAAIAEDERASATLADATSQLDAAQAESETAAAAAKATRAAADAADEKGMAALDAENAAQVLATKTSNDRAVAESALEAATAAAIKAKQDAEAAVAAETAASAALDVAGKAVSDRAGARDTAAEALAAADAALKDARTVADRLDAAESAAALAAADAGKQRAVLESAASAAAADARTAADARDSARRDLEQAQLAANKADAALQMAQQVAENAASLAADETGAPDTTSPDSPAAFALTAKRIALARRANADTAKQALKSARSAFDAADATATAATATANSAQASLEAAIAAVTSTSDAAARASTAAALARATLKEKSEARDQAAQMAADADGAAQQAGAAFDDAQSQLRAATDAANMAADTAKRAEAERAAAANAVASAASAAGEAAFALENATKERTARVDEAMRARVAANAAKATADDAAAALATATADHSAADVAATTAKAARASAEQAATAADASATAAEAAAADAEAVAKARSKDWEAAARRAGLATVNATDVAPVPVPAPRPRKPAPKPDALAGEQPLLLVPAQ